MVDQACEAKHPDDGQYYKGVIVQVLDKSLYLVGMYSCLAPVCVLLVICCSCLKVALHRV